MHYHNHVKFELNDGLKLFTVPPPGAGAILGFVLNVMRHYDVKCDKTLMYHRLVEAFKFAYAYRSRLGDPFDETVQEDVWQVRKK